MVEQGIATRTVAKVNASITQYISIVASIKTPNPFHLVRNVTMAVTRKTTAMMTVEKAWRRQ